MLSLVFISASGHIFYTNGYSCKWLFSEWQTKQLYLDRCTNIERTWRQHTRQRTLARCTTEPVWFKSFSR